jgi:PKD repeat protein
VPGDEFKSGQLITFAAAGSLDNAYFWDFGDGAASTEMVVQHAYAGPGLYTVTLTIFGEFGGRTQRTILVAADRPLVQVTYPTGWSLIGVPSETRLTGTLGPLYAWPFPLCSLAQPPPPPPGSEAGSVTQPPCATAYEAIPPGSTLQTGHGYWAYFPQQTTVALPFVPWQSPDFVLPPGQYMMVGNPGTTPAVVRGADAVFVYDTASGEYRPTDTLQPGQGAWVYASNDNTASAFISIAPVGSP